MIAQMFCYYCFTCHGILFSEHARIFVANQQIAFLLYLGDPKGNTNCETKTATTRFGVKGLAIKTYLKQTKIPMAGSSVRILSTLNPTAM